MTSEETSRRAEIRPEERSEETEAAWKAYSEKKDERPHQGESSGAFPRSETKNSKSSKKKRKRKTKPESAPSSASKFFKAEFANSNQSPKCDKSGGRQNTQAKKSERTRRRQADKAERQQKKATENRAQREKEAREAHDADAQYEHWRKFRKTETRDQLKTNYEELHRARKAYQANFPSQPFPTIPNYDCNRQDCMHSELLGCCHHGLQKTFKGSGQYSTASLKKERTYWHPDKFSGKGDGPLKTTELFKMIQKLLEENAGPYFPEP